MNKIYFMVSMAILTLFTSCKDFNATNFPGSDEYGKPTNVVQYVFTLKDADYATIATQIKKPVTDSVALMTTKLAVAKKAKSVDSIYIQSRLTALALKLIKDSTYIKATFIANNKYFNSKLNPKDYIPYLLNQNY